MKTLYITLILLLGESVLFAQDKKPLPDSTTNSLASVNPINGLLPNVTPKSPNATALGRFDEHPVSMYTGLATIEIPIFDIEAGGIKVPVKLSYHAGGNKVSDIASWVGLGWSLQYGGTVSRSMQGIPDEKNTNGNKGFLFGSLAVDINANSGNPNCVAAYGNLGNFENNFYDNGADMFSFSHSNGGGKFMFQANGQTIMMPDNRTKVSYTTAPLPLDDITTFKLVDESGFTHDYAYPELAEYVVGVGQTPVLFPSTWHIASITGTVPKDKVLFNYRSESFSHSLEDFSQRVTVVDSGGVSGSYTLPSPGSVAARNYNNVPYPTEIIFPTGKVVFVPEKSDRTDIPYSSKALDKIEIYGYNVATNTYDLIRTADLYQSYVAGILPTQNTRMLLDSVVMKDKSGTKVSSYTCEYNTTIKLPNYQSFNKDLWGYYNGQNNADLIQQQQVNFNGGTNNLTIGSANRNVFPFYTQALMLKKMTFPTGGYTTFEYEANQYLVGSVLTNAGGLRIRQIVSYPSTTTTLGAMYKTYKYGVAENGAGRLGAGWSNILSNQSLYKTAQNGVRFLSGRCNYTTYTARTYSSSPTVNLFPSDGSPVLYAEVTEYSDNGTSTPGIIGKTTYKFADTHTDNLITVGTSGVFHTESYQWDRGQLLEKTSYGNDGKKKHKVLTTYDLVSNQSLTGIRKLIFRQIASVGSASAVTCVNGCGYPNEVGTNGGFLVQTCNMPFGVSKPIKTEEFIYDNTDDTKFVLKTSTTGYDPIWLVPNISQTVVNGGEIRGQRMYYPQDFGTISGSPTAEVLAIKKLQESNRIMVAIEEVSFRKNSLTANEEIIGAKLITFENKSLSGVNLWTEPKDIYLLQSQAFGAFGSTPFQTSKDLFLASPTTSILPKHGLYEKKISLNGYDNDGNLIQYQLTEGQRTDKFNYLTVLHDGLTLSVLNSQTQDFGGLAHVSNFGYTIPLLGISSLQAPNQTQTNFGYDNFGRLKKIADQNGKILKSIDYQYNTTIPSAVIEYSPRIEMTAISSNTPINHVMKMVSFVDGLGRDLQKTIANASPDSTKDIVSSSVVYDAFGRAFKSFLPTPSSLNNGSFLANPQTQASSFYGDITPFSETTAFDNSPLNRPITNFGAGNAWRTANKSVGVQYTVAPANLIKKFKASLGAVYYNIEGSPNQEEFYGANEIQVKTTTTERGKKIVEYIDLQGRTVQKEVEADAGQLLTTIYVHDLYDRLAYVIQPQTYLLFSPTRTFILDTESDSKEGIFVYKFDRKSRQIQKRIAGHTDFEVMIYDRADRLVMNRDAGDDEIANSNGSTAWKFVKQDSFNRPVMSGLIFLPQGYSRQTVQTEFDTQPQNQVNETRTPLLGAGGLLNYANISFPANYTPNNASLRSLNYYDDYVWQTDNAYNFQASNAFHTQQLNVTGLATGSLVRNLSTNSWQKMVSYYDFKGRTIQDFHLTNRNNLIRKESQFRFNGDLLKIRIEKKNGSTVLSTKILSYDYDHLSRKKSFKYSLNGIERTIANYFYDEIGRLKLKAFAPSTPIISKQTGSWLDVTTWLTGILPNLSDKVTINSGHTVTIPSGNTANAGMLNINGTLKDFGTLNMGNIKATSPNILQILDYKYHIRGGMKGINLDANNNLTNNLFSYKIDYEDDGTYYDNNIRKQSWKSNIDNVTRTYTHDYDGSSRLTQSLYTSTKANENYNLNSVSYDRNGNILSLSRNGATNANYSAFGNVDNLTYSYQNNSNKLSKIADATTSNTDLGDFRDGINTGDDYEYWADGSLKKDKNKKLSSITYNYLKRPEVITFDNNRTITTEYDANGTKLKKIDSNGEVTDYEEDEIYVNGNLYQTSHDEGRIANGIFEYNITDHNNDLRVAFKDSAGIAVPTQSIFYDPWGLTMKGMQVTKNPANFNKYQFLNRETQFETGYIDLLNRQYDPQRGQFTSQDPITDGQEHLTLYQYGWNNPVLKPDPNGDCPDGDCGDDASYVFANIALTIFYDVTHAVANTGFRMAGSDLRATYPRDADGNQTYGVDFIKVPKPTTVKEVGKEILATGLDLVAVSPMKSGGSVGLLAKSSETQTVRAAKNAVGASTTSTTSTSRAGKAFTPAEKAKVIDANAAKNQGKVVCESCGVTTTKPAKSTKGVTPPKTDRQIDHKTPKSKGGGGTAENGQVLCRDCNRAKSDN